MHKKLYYVYNKAFLHYHLPDSPFSNDLQLEPHNTDTDDFTVITGDFANISFQP